MQALKSSPHVSTQPGHLLAAETGKRVSEEVYWKKYYEHPDFNYEWNNGLLEEKPMADFLSFQLYRWFFQLLEEYLKVYPQFQMTGLEIGFSLDTGKKKSVRKPDLAIIAGSNSIQMTNEERSFKGTYDLCIEFLSDSTRKEIERGGGLPYTIDKKAEYEAVGVREYFILGGGLPYRLGHHTSFYRLNEQGYYQTIEPINVESSDVIQSHVLEGFAFRLQDLDAMPPFENLIDLPMYQPFVMKTLQQAKAEKKQVLQRVEQTFQREKQERVEKEQVLQRVEHLLALLKKAGIDPTDEIQ